MQPNRRNPRGLDLKMTNDIAHLAKLGMFHKDIAAAVRISPVTLSKWLSRGEEDFDDDILSIYAQLYEEVTSGEAEFITRAVVQWQAQWKDDWRSIQAFLKARWPKHWGAASEAIAAGESVEAVRVILRQEEYEAI